MLLLLSLFSILFETQLKVNCLACIPLFCLPPTSSQFEAARYSYMINISEGNTTLPALWQLGEPQRKKCDKTLHVPSVLFPVSFCFLDWNGWLVSNWFQPAGLKSLVSNCFIWTIRIRSQRNHFGFPVLVKPKDYKAHVPSVVWLHVQRKRALTCLYTVTLSVFCKRTQSEEL